jgi:hypothetical protein
MIGQSCLAILHLPIPIVITKITVVRRRTSERQAVHMTTMKRRGVVIAGITEVPCVPSDFYFLVVI